jgi:hypothetical protein
MRSRVLIPAFLVLAASCDVFDPDIDTELGTIFHFNSPVRVAIPDSVRVGQPFTVDIRTYGDGCASFARTQIETETESRTTVEIKPFDRLDTRDPCPDILQTIAHPATLQFRSPGVVTITVKGRRLPGGGEETITRSVTIR